MKNQFYAVWPNNYICKNVFNMEKTKLYLNDISELLGPGEERYFSSGFKGINILYGDARIDQGCYTDTVDMQFGSWSKKNGAQLTPHAGTTEFIAIAATVCQQLMEKEAGLDPIHVEQSWISRFYCKMKPCGGTDYHCIPLSGNIISKQTKVKHFVYEFSVKIGMISVELTVCCPVKHSDENSYEEDENKVDLYRKGYKLRDLAITNVHVDGESLRTAGKTVLYGQTCPQKGIGARYSGMLLTDFILITGQLTQALLCHINHTSRSKSANLWLREIDAWCDDPSEEKVCDSEVRFLNFRTLRKKEDTWQVVELSGTVGNMHANIKVAQMINQHL
jgi:hypothetical protein